jgi:hypothetical protein
MSIMGKPSMRTRVAALAVALILLFVGLGSLVLFAVGLKFAALASAVLGVGACLLFLAGIIVWPMLNHKS